VPRGGVLDEAPDCSTDISVCAEREAAPTATIALAAAFVGLLFGLLGVSRGPGWCAAVAFGALLVLPFQGPFLGPDVTMHGGLLLALSLSAVAGCVHVRRAWQRRGRAFFRRRTRTVDRPAPKSGSGPLDVVPEHVGPSGPRWRLSGVQGSSSPKEATRMDLHGDAALSWRGRPVVARQWLTRDGRSRRRPEGAGVRARCARKRVGRYRAGERDLLDRSSAPRRVWNRTDPAWVEFPGSWGELQYFHAPAPIGTVASGSSRSARRSIPNGLTHSGHSQPGRRANRNRLVQCPPWISATTPPGSPVSPP
jgi:hypothetical protein